MQQKRVDILSGVDPVSLSAKKHIQQAIIVAGDSDFIPAVAAAKNEGIVVKIYHGRECRSDFREEADEHYRIDQRLVDSVRL